MQLLAESEIDIFVVVLEKEVRVIDDSPENYARILFPAVQEIVLRFPNAVFAFDKHFSKPAHSAQVKQALERLANRQVDLEPADSQQISGIQIADFVAGATLAKYQREEETYLDLLSERIILERWLSWSEIKKW